MTKLVLTVITVYILCWLPYWVTQLALITQVLNYSRVNTRSSQLLTMTSQPPGESQGKTMLIIHLLASCLSYSNSAMNPVLYAFLSDNFKKSFMKACRCWSSGREEQWYY